MRKLCGLRLDVLLDRGGSGDRVGLGVEAWSGVQRVRVSGGACSGVDWLFLFLFLYLHLHPPPAAWLQLR